VAAQQFQALHIPQLHSTPLLHMQRLLVPAAGAAGALLRQHPHSPFTCSALLALPPRPRYALGVFTRQGGSSGSSSTGRLEVMPAEGGKILRMEPRVRGV